MQSTDGGRNRVPPQTRTKSGLNGASSGGSGKQVPMKKMPNQDHFIQVQCKLASQYDPQQRDKVGGWGVLNREIVSFCLGVRTRGLVA